MNIRATLSTFILLAAATATAQERSSSSLYLAPQAPADVTLPFSLQAEGHRFAPTWGLDQAWINEQNLRKGLNHMGRENIGVGRSAFRTTKALTNDSVLQSDQTSFLRQRANMFDIVDSKLPLILTADQEAGSDEYFVKNRSANVDHWAANINSHVHWLQENTQHPVIGVSPFNEPDYWTAEEGATTAKQAQVAQILKTQYPRFADIAIVGGNTLNDDKAWNWFNEGRDYYDWGNTHQLAGSMASYVSFHQRLAELGKTGYNDEMHNVAEAMIGLEYGMTVGIWWAFDSRARGEFCDISRHGERLAYAEHRNNWTAASVYRHDDGRVKAFIGSSERQAYTTTYQFLSADRDVYFDGHGPMRAFSMEMPGGTGYQTGQTNAERVVDITWGEDVQPMPITEGVYKIVNRATGNVVAVNSSAIVQQKWTGVDRQKWTIKPCSPRTGGDYSFYDIESVTNANLRINVKNFSTADNAQLIAYEQAGPTSNEQWYLEYAGDGYYYIRNRESALYMASFSTSSANGVRVTQTSMLSEAARNRLMWRLLPVDVAYETKAPQQPQNLEAKAQSASVLLTWDANTTDTDLDGYMVLRAEADGGTWNTIARRLSDCYFVDHTIRPATSYIYKVRAIDRAQNLSELSEEARTTTADAPTLVARWQMDGDLNDATENLMDARFGAASPQYIAEARSGQQSLKLTATSKEYVQLPYDVARWRELTFCAWVNVRTSSAWQRIFDFGYDTDHYIFLTPYNGRTMRFAIKNGGEEQTLDCPERLTPLQWRHVVVSMAEGLTTIYIDGEPVAQSSAITITPADVAPVLNYLGRSQFAADPYFTGYLDDVRLYNYALTAEEAAAVMADTSSGIHPVQPSMPTSSDAVYGVDGIRRPSAVKGIKVSKGKKWVE
ncbi:MAG: RICIN domain-containing protein [Prevotella sp.]|nr:RICIN domain-containing protein [Prevotella sp.]